MIIEMSKVRILGARERLEDVLRVLQDLNLLHLSAPEAVPLTHADLTTGQERERRHLQAALDNVEQALDAGREINLFGSSVAPDYLTVGGDTGYVAGKVTYTAGNVSYTEYRVYGLWESGALLINGGSGADWLYPTMTGVATTAVKGAIVFLGGGGNDRITMETPRESVVTARFDRSNDPILNASMAHITPRVGDIALTDQLPHP